MKATLTLKPHSILPDTNVVEVFWRDQLICTVTGLDGPGVRIISKYRVADTAVEPPRLGLPGATSVRLDISVDATCLPNL